MPAVYSLTDDIVKYLVKLGILDAAGGYRATLTAKTGNYTIDATVDPSATVFTNRGAGAGVTFTLPAPTRALAGVYYKFVGVADQTFTVSAGAGNAVTFNNAAATSVACSTGGQKIGAQITAYCDGTSWLLTGNTLGVTYTVA